MTKKQIDYSPAVMALFTAIRGKELGKSATVNNISNTKKENMLYSVTPSKEFEVTLTNKLIELKTVLDARQAYLPDDGIVIPEFGIWGTELVLDFATKLTDFAFKVGQSDEASSLIEIYLRQYHPAIHEDIRNHVFMTMCMLEANAHFSEIDDWDGELTLTRKLLNIINV